MPDVELFGAMARGYCTAENSHKILDPDLIKAMAAEVEKLLVNRESKCISGEPQFVVKPWGNETWLSENKFYCYKRIFIKAGHRTSLQYHKFKFETNYLIAGEARVLLGETWHNLKAGDFFDVEPWTQHRVEAVTDIILQEASSSHTSDVIRVEDDTQRPDGRIESEHA